jgi:hypothetical protein
VTSRHALLALCALSALATSCSKCSSSRRTETVTEAPEQKKPSPTDASLSRYLAYLPPDAAIYGTLRLDLVDALVPVVPAGPLDDLKRELKDRWGAAPTKADIADTMGLDASRPIAFALVPGASSEIVGLMKKAKSDGGTQAAVSAAFEAAKKSARPPKGGLSIVFPRAAGKNVDKLVDFMTVVGPRTKLARCAAPTDCPKIGDRQPSFFSPELAIYVTDDAVRVDRLIDRGTTNEQSTSWLAWLGGARGGPKARCTALDDAALASICLSAPELGALGQGSGAFRVLDALAGPGIDDPTILRILTVGDEEIGRIAELLAAPAGDLSDGTWTLQNGEKLQAIASFRLGAEKPAGFEQAECSKTVEEVSTKVMPRLRDGLLGAKPPYTSQTELMSRVNEAGWTGSAILAAGKWPLLLPFFEPHWIAKPVVVEPCVSVEKGRLYVRATIDPTIVGSLLR